MCLLPSTGHGQLRTFVKVSYLLGIPKCRDIEYANIDIDSSLFYINTSGEKFSLPIILDYTVTTVTKRRRKGKTSWASRGFFVDGFPWN